MNATATSLYNASIAGLRENARARVIRVVPDESKRVYQAGQYGSLGLASESEPGKLVKRAYSISSPILNLESGRIDDPSETPHYEFYFNKVAAPPGARETLSPRLFSLKDGDRLFCGPKVTGHYTIERLPEGRNVLLIATTTGEAANNSIAALLLAERRPIGIASVLLGDAGWTSLYAEEHARAAELFKNYRPITLFAADARAQFLARLESWCRDPKHSDGDLGFPLRPETAQVFLVGDPELIGAPKKLGAWGLERAQNGAIPTLTKHGFSIETRFKEGDIHYETYW